MVNANPNPVSGTEDRYDQLEKSLETLAALKPKQKIRILNPHALSIAVEDRWWISRWWSGDGVHRTIDMIYAIMDQCLSFSALETETSEESVKKRNARLKQLYPLALQGIRLICELYGSPEEKEYEPANRLAIRINGYVLSVRQLVDGPSQTLVPQPMEPCKILSRISHPSKSIPVATLTALSILCTLVSYCNRTMTVITFTGEILDCRAVLPALLKVSSMLPYLGTASTVITWGNYAIQLTSVLGEKYPKIRLFFKTAQVLRETEVL